VVDDPDPHVVQPVHEFPQRGGLLQLPLPLVRPCHLGPAHVPAAAPARGRPEGLRVVAAREVHACVVVVALGLVADGLFLGNGCRLIGMDTHDKRVIVNRWKLLGETLTSIIMRPTLGKDSHRLIRDTGLFKRNDRAVEMCRSWPLSLSPMGLAGSVLCSRRGLTQGVWESRKGAKGSVLPPRGSGTHATGLACSAC
jgi:hypothetical protein